MRKINIALITLIIAFAAIGRAAGQEPLVAYKYMGQWHVLDNRGNEFFPPFQANKVKGYGDGLICFSKKRFGLERWGYMNMKGDVVISPQYDIAFPFSDNRALVANYLNETTMALNFHYINKKGEKINDKEYIDALPFSEGLAFCMEKKNKSGYIDTSGAKVLDMNGLIGNKFSEGLASFVDHSMQQGYINRDSEVIIESEYSTAKEFSEGLAAVSIGTKFGYVNAKSETQIKLKFDDAKSFNCGRAFVGDLYPKKFQTKWGIIDTSGFFVVHYKYWKINNFREGLASVKETDKWGFVDKKGEYAIEPKFSYAGSFFDGLAYVAIEEEEKFGFIDKKGKFILQIPRFSLAVDLRLNEQVYK